MGCDIHLYKEKQVNGEWVAADEWTPDKYEPSVLEVNWEKRFTDRNYQLFGFLSAGVREEIGFAFQPRGIPFNASTEVAVEVERWGVDGHSHSYLYLHELRDAFNFIQKKTITIDGMKEFDGLAELQTSISSGAPNWDLLFPYCQSTNAPGHVKFSIDVPASFYFGEALQRIINSFDGVDGDNHRIVFFFDN